MLIGKYLNKYYLKYWWCFLFGIAGLLATDYCTTEIPIYLQYIVDEIDGISADRLLHISLMVLLFAGLAMVARMLWRLCIFYASRKIMQGLRQDMFEKAETLSLNYYRQNNTGTVMGYFTTDVDQIGESFGWGTVMIIDAVFMTAIVLYRMFSLNVALTLVALIPTLLIFVWGILVDVIIERLWDGRQRSYDKLYDFTTQNFTGIRVIKAFVKENQQIHAFSKLARKNFDANFKLNAFSSVFDAILEIILAVIITLILGFGTYFIYQTASGNVVTLFGLDATMTIGELVSFTAYFDLLVWPVIAAGQVISVFSRSRISYKRIARFLSADVDVASPIDAVEIKDAKGTIEFRDFSFSYPDESGEAISHLSLKIEPGERIGVVGKIGSGKTTIANVLTRLYNFEEGCVFLDGVDLMKADIRSLRSQISYAPQDNFLYSDTIENNIAFSSPTIEEEKVKEAASFADVASNIEAFPQGYQTVSGERGVTLSGGQKQRISLARAYYHDAPILILDDTVSAVDLKTETEILSHIEKLGRDKTVLVIASRVSTIRHFDKILVLEDGKAVGFASHEQLMKECPAYQKMVHLQALEALAESKEGWSDNG